MFSLGTPGPKGEPGAKGDTGQGIQGEIGTYNRILISSTPKGGDP